LQAAGAGADEHCVLALQRGAQPRFGQRRAGRIGKTGEDLCCIPIVDIAGTKVGLQYQQRIVDQRGGAQWRRRQPRMRAQGAVALHPIDPRRQLEIDVHPLRTVLQKPAAAIIGGIVAADEVADRRVNNRLATNPPLAALRQQQPAVHRRHVRPLGDGRKDIGIH